MKLAKAARNEQRKMLAGLMNTLAAAFFLASCLQPALALVQGQRPVTLAELLLSSILLVVSMALVVTVQVIVSWLED